MRTIVVVSRPGDWPLELPGVQVVLAHEYLTDPLWTKERGVRVYNLCRSYRYQTHGYYVSLLAAARGHSPFPGLLTVLDTKSRAVVRVVSSDIEELAAKSLADIRSANFELSVYFGQNMAARHERLAKKLFQSFPVPLLRAKFAYVDEAWALSSISPIAYRDVPDSHHEFLLQAATAYFSRPRYHRKPSSRRSYSLAILADPEEVLAPSDEKALGRFERAANDAGFEVEQVGKDDYARIAEFDALFIRETTAVDHHTFRFAQRAANAGLVVVDDPESILRCTNKVFQTEALEIRDVPTPPTIIVDALDPAVVEERIGFPCVLKFPDSAFSQGVIKCEDRDAYVRQAARVLDESDLILVQAFMPSDFDWRIGVFDGEPLYACRYHMAKGHWQIVKNDDKGGYDYGRVDTMPLFEVPKQVVRIALKAAATIGDGLYGVDLKQFGEKVVVTEVNDNPNINAGIEDKILKGDLYRRIMEGFRRRVEERKTRQW
ncbi:MAG: RimK family protein [Planctomycetota bacterium]